MKTILSLFVMILLLTTTSKAKEHKDVSVDPRVLKAFGLTYPSVRDVSWHEEGNRFTASFSVQQIAIVATYDAKGELIRIRRSYSVEFLTPSTLIQIQKRHPAKKIFGITEVSDGSETIYEVTMQDEKFWYKVWLDATGGMQTMEKFRRAEPRVMN